MLVFEVKKEKADEMAGFFMGCGVSVAGIIETHCFSGSSELIQIAIMVTAATIGNIVSLVKKIKNGSIDVRIRGNGEEIDPKDITEEYLSKNCDDIS